MEGKYRPVRIKPFNCKWRATIGLPAKRHLHAIGVSISRATIGQPANRLLHANDVPLLACQQYAINGVPLSACQQKAIFMQIACHYRPASKTSLTCKCCHYRPASKRPFTCKWCATIGLPTKQHLHANGVPLSICQQLLADR